MKRLLVVVVLALAAVPAAADARQRVVGRYKVDFTAKLDNGGTIHSLDAASSSLATETADGMAHFTLSAHWTANVTLRAGKTKKRGKPYVDVTNTNAPGPEQVRNLVLGSPQATARTQASWSGTYPDDADGVTVHYSCAYDYADSALAKFVRVAYVVPSTVHRPPDLSDGRRDYLGAYLSVQQTARGETASQSVVSACQSDDPRPEWQNEDFHSAAGVAGTPLGAMFTRLGTDRGATFPIKKLLRRKGKPLSIEVKTSQTVGTSAVPPNGYAGTTDAVITAKLR